ncbi:FAD-binding domain-containing protein [Aurantiacibacter gangjinensis]|uniref:DNA photolyase n=1 Tax=Aurantiacibacter gangjinensis TaxID=502682 RepID=A0A0G9MMT6_9SPHN|nr:FAD-binding domain-containing protein [Aurantiacibacter gangjinensis]APE27990.1 Deoxyribodipyrimidine photolyase [Aurantiacibacter gangjinensis]KLE31929.1 DNA photolyase [Aurantiacibacter gangjinensis]
MDWTADRSTALRRLQEFAPDAGRRYASSRNHDTGPGRSNVSQLSPWLHAGLLSEREVLAAVLTHHSPSQAEKFVSEVFWRIYFKGFLEQHPSIWRAYCDDRDAALADLDDNAGRRTAYNEAVEGRTGIAAFDHWARELVETGYLHNHARMWFASIWIFTLKLDWTLGADFFLRHLMDGDAASNTLNWRWVAGLHTKGKTYLARQGNITRYTSDHPEGSLEADGLTSEAPALEEDRDHPRRDLDLPDGDLPQGRYALLLHDEAASHAPLALEQPPALVIGAARPDARSPLPIGDKARDFALQAVAKGVVSASEAFECPSVDWGHGDRPEDILQAQEIDYVVAPYLPVGWTRDSLWPRLEPLANSDRLTQILPELARQTWPEARAGFYRVRKAIPDILDTAGFS